MSNLFLVLFLLSFVGLIIGLVKPSWLRMESRKQASIVAGGATLLFFVLFGITSPPTAPKDEVVVGTPSQLASTSTPVKVTGEKLVSAPTSESAVSNPSARAGTDAQKDLADFMALAKTAKVFTSFDFTNDAVVYVGSAWYSLTVLQKKDFIAKVGTLKKAATGYAHFEARDTYSNEKVAEITSFSQSIEVYK